ncbi:hypothetical protein J983_3677 [Acinetobacter baumannii 44298_7]|nr:hypothetical protein J931_2057 [Acinetobacter baumannii 44437_8]EYC67542.1 hypothetical protein J928_2318 [Acinetobacter baumannii 44437_5]EYC71525.1 hypothetical protein J927_2247 [Acinetobacter baumannii 44437_4]EYU54748.1 hypothetical protein J696_00178 [Acinetobacter baumannii 1428368]EZI71072.1 hypothetical protein J986_2360 [Acinetobacter baumannii 44298_10]EZI75130.1 hypothetical protein J985_2354 [Acinetobacter baumannii 44298_9]EZI77186.1 hypothetical protein J983_3677 [Acinetobac
MTVPKKTLGLTFANQLACLEGINPPCYFNENDRLKANKDIQE